MTVPAAIRESEKIEMVRRTDFYSGDKITVLLKRIGQPVFFFYPKKGRNYVIVKNCFYRIPFMLQGSRVKNMEQHKHFGKT